MISFKDGKKSKLRHVNLQRQISQLPINQQQMLKDTSRIVEETMLDVEDGIWSGESFRLHDQMKNFFLTHGLHDTDNTRDELYQKVHNYPKGQIFNFLGKYFLTTFDGKLVSANDYIYILEKSVMTKESIQNICTFISLNDIFKMLVLKIKAKILGVKDATK